MNRITKLFFVFILGVFLIAIGLQLSELAVVLLGGLLSTMSSLFILASIFVKK